MLKLGRIALYRKTRPFFLGTVPGTFATAGTWLIIDYLAGHPGSFVTLS